MKCTCPEDWQGMDHTAGCKTRSRTITLPKPTKDQEDYLRKIAEATGKYDPNYMVGGPRKPVTK